MIRNRLHIILALAFAVAVSVSCAHREKLEPEPAASSKNQYSDKVTFTLGTAASVSPQTKSVAQAVSARRFLGVQGSDSIFVTSSVSNNNNSIEFRDEPAVKGAVVTSSTLDGFYVSANIDETLKYIDWHHINGDNKVTVDEQTVYDTDYYWPQQSLDFFACNFDQTPGGPVVTISYDDDDNYVAEMSYTLPEPGANKQDALNQPDYVVAISEDRVQTGGVVPLEFAHCLSAVTLKMGSSFLDPEGRMLNEVRIKNVKKGGVCAIAKEGNNVSFAWETSDAIETYIQEINAEVPDGSVINAGDITFMLIPQEISQDAEIEFAFTLHDGMTSLDGEFSFEHEWTVSVKLSELTTEWLPGKKYTYSLSGEEIVDVEVQDEFISNDPMVKGNLSITNTGNVPVYVRAYIVGWWENSEGVVVAPWTNNDGEWSGAAWEKGTSNWVISDHDGFFYHTQPVDPGQTTEKLFDTYTLTAVSPNPDARLILNVVTQAVLHYQVEQAWPHATSTVGINGFRVSNTESYW